MKTPLYETSLGALETLLETNSFVTADLYTYTLVGGTIMRYSAADRSILYGGNTWTAGQVLHDTTDSKSTGHWKVGLDIDTWTVTVTPRATDPITGTAFPDTIGSTPWISAVRAGALDGAVVQIDRAYAADWPDVGSPFVPVGILTIFTGRVAALEAGRLSVTITLNDMREILQTVMPHNIWMSNCHHVLFSTGCALLAASFKVSTTATSGSTRNVLLSTAVPPTSPGSGDFTLGRVVMTGGLNAGVQRFVKKWVSGTFTLMSPLPFNVSPGDGFDCYPGCDRTQADCTLFQNDANFGGQPFIPAPETAI